MLKTVLALPILLTVGTAAAQASELRMTVEKPHFTCEGRGSLLSHVAYVPGEYRHRISDDAPLPCCDGQIGCAQFLSTNTILRADRPQRG